MSTTEDEARRRFAAAGVEPGRLIEPAYLPLATAHASSGPKNGASAM